MLLPPHRLVLPPSGLPLHHPVLPAHARPSRLQVRGGRHLATHCRHDTGNSKRASASLDPPTSPLVPSMGYPMLPSLSARSRPSDLTRSSHPCAAHLALLIPRSRPFCPQEASLPFEVPCTLSVGAPPAPAPPAADADAPVPTPAAITRTESVSKDEDEGLTWDDLLSSVAQYAHRASNPRASAVHAARLQPSRLGCPRRAPPTCCC